jgi:hypothetical protein
MTGRDDYLFDPAEPPDPEIAALERALAPLRRREVRWREAPPPPARRRWPWFAAIAAAALLAAVVVWWARGDADALRRGAPVRTFVAKGEQRIQLGDLAEITLRPGSELTFEHWREDQALFTLARGGLQARVEPPPKVPPQFFVVATPLGRVVDQGCRFTLDLVADGTALLAVHDGAVTFTVGERTAWVPGGASTRVDAAGPSVPLFDDANAELKKAVRLYEETLAKADVEARGGAIKHVLAACRAPRDTLVLWHLLRDPEPMYREVVERHLLDTVGAPPFGVQDSYDPEEWLAFLRQKAWRR